MAHTKHILIVRHGGLEIPVEVTRKRVKNLNLRVRADGSVSLSIPTWTPLARAQEFLDRKTPWIAQRVANAQARNAHRDLAPSLPDLLPLWGELTPRDPALSSQSAIDELYRDEVRRVLPGVAESVERRIGVHATRWSVRVMKTRWGSCTPRTGAIRINARLAAYPIECLEFVVAHEMIHLLEPSHNARFHALLDEFCPDNRRLAQQLKQNPLSA